MQTTLIATLLLQAVSAVPKVDFSDAGAVQAMAAKGAANLASYYPPNALGAVPQKAGNDASSIQWYESGIMWETLMRTAALSGNPAYVGTAARALVNASYGPASDFLGPAYYRQFASNALGMWNDDIAWWGQAAISGCELFSPDTTMPSGGTFLDLAGNTINDVWQSWDSNTCQGGIFWTRDRNSANPSMANYKSTITNAQFVSMAARVYQVTNNATYLERSQIVYHWLTTSGIVSADAIYDGADAPTCTDYSSSGLAASYIYGQLIQGLVNLYTATGQQSYLSDAELYATKALSLFTVNSILTDSCEPNCWVTNVTPKGILLRGLATLYPVGSAPTKLAIKTVVDASLAAMLQTCTDDFACGNAWSAASLQVYSDFHTQLNAVELMNMALVMYAPLSKPTKFSYQSPAPAEAATQTAAQSSAQTKTSFLMECLAALAAAVVAM
ncbi:hydrolase 76 protein [Kappamyces sp. JEL0680]|nr:hydrolase 76 protein [Kappamyces sp. JEL0680]